MEVQSEFIKEQLVIGQLVESALVKTAVWPLAYVNTGAPELYGMISVLVCGREPYTPKAVVQSMCYTNRQVYVAPAGKSVDEHLIHTVRSYPAATLVF